MEESHKKQTTLTGSQILSEKITLGGCEEKQSGRYRYLKTQVIYDDKAIYCLKSVEISKFFHFKENPFQLGCQSQKIIKYTLKQSKKN